VVVVVITQSLWLYCCGLTVIVVNVVVVIVVTAIAVIVGMAVSVTVVMAALFSQLQLSWSSQACCHHHHYGHRYGGWCGHHCCPCCAPLAHYCSCHLCRRWNDLGRYKS
jgi:hypothetical protein